VLLRKLNGRGKKFVKVGLLNVGWTPTYRWLRISCLKSVPIWPSIEHFRARMLWGSQVLFNGVPSVPISLEHRAVFYDLLNKACGQREIRVDYF
jgi:hypothetical protein